MWVARVIDLNCNRGDYRVARERRCLRSLEEKDSVPKELWKSCECSNSKAKRVVNATSVVVVVVFVCVSGSPARLLL